MKWIGQNIWDYISRFRSDVYMEDISSGTIASGGNLGLDSNNKIVKANVPSSLTFSGSSANGILTYGGASQIDVESTLTFSGGVLGNLTGGLSIVAGGDLALFGSPTVSVTSARLDISGSSASAAQLYFYEDTDNGTDAVRIIGPASTSGGTLTLPDASGEFALTNKHIVVIRAAFHSSSTSGYYLTIGGGTTGESSALASYSYTNIFSCPYDGQVKRIAASTQSTGNKTVKLEMYINKDDSDLVADQRGTDWNVSSYTNSWCEDSPGDWTFSKGENIAIKATDSAAVYGTQYTVVLEFDLTT